MQFLISVLMLVLIAIAFFAIKFIQGEEQEQKRRERKNNESIADLETKLKKAQEEFAKEKLDKQEVENILYKTKDELDNLKNQNSELVQRVGDLTNDKEAIKQEIAENDRLKSELEATRKQIEQIKKDKDNLQKELENIKKDAEPLKKENEPLKKENEDLKNKLKFLQEIHEGLKGQYDELSKQMEEINQQRILDASGGASQDKKPDTKANNSEDNITPTGKNSPPEPEQEKPPSGSPENKPKE